VFLRNGEKRGEASALVTNPFPTNDMMKVPIAMPKKSLSWDTRRATMIQHAIFCQGRLIVQSMTPERVLFSSGLLSHGFLLMALVMEVGVRLLLLSGVVLGKEAAECGIIVLLLLLLVVVVIVGMEGRGEKPGVLLKLLL
jgi:hypothetical protein